MPQFEHFSTCARGDAAVAVLTDPLQPSGTATADSLGTVVGGGSVEPVADAFVGSRS